MAARYSKSKLRWLRFAKGRRKTTGFTLIELLVGIIIASLVILGLLSLVVDLLQTNQRESAQTETQREMQMALDFISSELREAVYVYDGACLNGQGVPTSANPNSCPGIRNHIPVPADSVPILAFWKLDPFPQPVVATCRAGTNTTAPCSAGRSYTLVTYFLRRSQPTDNPKWQGRAQITRYAMTKFASDGTENTKYVNPEESGTNFNIWPYQASQPNFINLQTARGGVPAGNAVTLVDFVDDTTRPGDTATDTNICPAQYSVSPPSALLTGAYANVRSFYACVKQGTGAFHQDALVFLRGNAAGRGGINNDRFLPTLQTQVLRRGIVNKVPSPLN